MSLELWKSNLWAIMSLWVHPCLSSAASVFRVNLFSLSQRFWCGACVLESWEIAQDTVFYLVNWLGFSEGVWKKVGICNCSCGSLQISLLVCVKDWKRVPWRARLRGSFTLFSHRFTLFGEMNFAADTKPILPARRDKLWMENKINSSRRCQVIQTLCNELRSLIIRR